MSARTRARIGAQSRTVARTSASVASRSCCSLCRACASVTRSISYSCQDSACAGVAPLVPMSRSRPRRSRLTGSTGCTIRCTARSARANAMPRESTRNGMSSVTVSTSVCGDSKPSAPGSGLKTRTSERPWVRRAAKLRCASAARESSCGVRAARSSSATPWKYARRKRCVSSRRTPAPALRAMRSMSATRAAGMLWSCRLSSTATACMPDHSSLKGRGSIARARRASYDRAARPRIPLNIAARDYTWPRPSAVRSGRGGAAGRAAAAVAAARRGAGGYNVAALP